MELPRTAHVSSTRGSLNRATRRSSRIGSILGASTAALVSAGLIFWLGTTPDSTSGTEAVSRATPVNRTYAPPTVDAAQVVRSREQLQDVYARDGLAGVERFSRECADRVVKDPKSLDLCISFNVFADALNGIPSSGRGAGQLPLIRAVLPTGQDAEARLAEIRLLAAEVSIDDLEGPPRVNPSPPPAEAKAQVAERTAVKATASKARKSPPRNNDARLRVAYQRAAAAGVNPSVLGREQRQFRRAVQGAGNDRSAVDRLYARRIRTLEIQAGRSRS